MAQGALDSHGFQVSLGVKKNCYADNRIEFKQRESSCRIIQVYLTCLDLRHQLRRQCIGIYFQAYAQGGLRAYAGPDSSIFGSGNGLMQLEGIAPKCFVAKSVEAEYLSALFKLPADVVLND